MILRELETIKRTNNPPGPTKETFVIRPYKRYTSNKLFGIIIDIKVFIRLIVSIII